MNEDRSVRYHRLRRRAAILSTFTGALWLLVLCVSGAAGALGAWISTAGGVGQSPFGRALAIALFVSVVVLGYEAFALPLAFYRSFLLERKYGLSSEAWTAWLADHLKALGIGLLLMVLASEAAYASMYLSGRWWWVVSAAVFALAGLALVIVAPVVLMPLFYRFRPLERETLRTRLVALSGRAGVHVLGAFEWGLGEKTTRANAALVGLGRTRRILVSDTLLKDYSDDEIEVILAHELAHHVHHDIWTGLAMESIGVAAALLAAHLVATALSPAFHFGGPADLSALPLMALAGGAVSVVLTPFANAWSRRNERRADRFALALTGGQAAFISAMRRLGAQNLAEQRPSSPIVWLFHTHPTMEERIAVARGFGRAAEAARYESYP